MIKLNRWNFGKFYGKRENIAKMIFRNSANSGNVIDVLIMEPSTSEKRDSEHLIWRIFVSGKGKIR
jgi:hypothetical protein